MTYVVKVAPGFRQVPLPGGLYDQGQQVTLTDDQYNQLPLFVAKQLITVSPTQSVTPVPPTDSYTTQLIIGAVQEYLASIGITATNVDNSDGTGTLTIIDDFGTQTTAVNYAEPHHPSRHASGAADPITPASIGAVSVSQKDVANGVPSLDASAKIPLGEIPDVAGRACSTDGTDGLPVPTGVGMEFVITATGLDDIRYNGTSL